VVELKGGGVFFVLFFTGFRSLNTLLAVLIRFLKRRRLGASESAIARAMKAKKGVKRISWG